MEWKTHAVPVPMYISALSFRNFGMAAVFYDVRAGGLRTFIERARENLGLDSGEVRELRGKSGSSEGSPGAQREARELREKPGSSQRSLKDLPDVFCVDGSKLPQGTGFGRSFGHHSEFVLGNADFS
ncbi:hypothetical protein CEB3_c36690 [Peptococcaceae bacterium CEB3]|nr:hypothetical protein CEB3_c36690 [Peptococcaceae bacterium CEB3]